jgi:EAL domain-containing protein (putative c-di-GMP-specific phosphodiesterase class I)
MVIVADRMTDESAAALAERIHEIIREPFALAGREVSITLSVGITLATGYEDVAGVLRSSDAAMYASKGRTRPLPTAARELQTSSARAAVLFPELKGALERGELSVSYQPLVRIADGSPIGFEALLRWNHPEHGSISPLEFIPIAEESGLIVVPIGEWVLQQAVAQMHRWRTELPGGEDLTISVNVSAVQMLDPGFVPIVESIIDEAGIDPGAVTLELTESIVMNDIEKASGGLESLRAVGVGIAIDDFGVGYSSLAYLRDLPVTSIKIDRSFVAPVDSDAPRAKPILKAIVGLINAAGLDAVAEGVETPAQWELLREYGVQVGQGYVWSRPMPAEAVPGWLAEQSVRQEA